MTRAPLALAAVAVLFGLTALSAPARAVQPDDELGEDSGLGLLRQAAHAVRVQAYYGTQFVTMWNPEGSSSSLVDVTSVPGVGITVKTMAAGEAVPGTVELVDPATPAGGLAAPHDGMIDVMARNFEVTTAGEGRVCGRPTRIVEVMRPGGAPAARYWIDEASGVILRREILDAGGRLARASAFIDFRLPEQAKPGAYTDGNAFFAVADAPALKAKGWDFPATLPGRLELFSADESENGYLQLGYSDGLSMVSVFVQPGTLDEEGLRGWHPQRRGGHTIWVRDSVGQEMIWASGGHVYTVFTDAPADMVDAAVSALPHEAEPGVLARLGRGAQTVLAWLNPFA
ncbi:sigma-E factor negative regulatory protein RseB [Sinosporangium album]|uniref:Sigma-E factor negative regulatory protein RseB n=1 Tax=Sinosporangium album TaxID=504805 RepID=A0A1G7Y6A5_9ACTN|nr:sigma-E factor regulatory protein RseB domain-containing protein [Sinosporangium album]SDG91909.1 sigma-E factor negative regulatory protein RseB [Sinosporangium album]